MAAGEPDVDAFLDRLTPQQFNELRAAELLEPITLRYVVEVLKLGFAAMVNVLRVEGEPVGPENFDPVRPERKPNEGFVSPNAGAALFRGLSGV